MFNRIKRGIALFLCAISVFIFNPSYLMPTVMAEEAAGEILLEASNTFRYAKTDSIVYFWNAYASGQYGWAKVYTDDAHVHIFYNTTDGYLWFVSAFPNILMTNIGNERTRLELSEIATVDGIDFYYLKINKTYNNIALDPATLDSKIPSFASLEEALSIPEAFEYSDTDGVDAVVSASVEAGYTVKLPAVMQLTYNSSTRRFEYNYTVSVKGIVDENKMLAVVPNASVSLYNAARTEYLTANVIQTKSYWVNNVTDDSTQNLIDYGTYTGATGVCYLNKVKSGNWSGLLHFTFSVVDQ